MDNERRQTVEKAQKILDGEIMKSDGSIKSKVDSYKDEKYSVQFFSKENLLIRAINIPEEWIEDANDKLRSLLRDLEQETKAKKKRR